MGGSSQLRELCRRILPTLIVMCAITVLTNCPVAAYQENSWTEPNLPAAAEAESTPSVASSPSPESEAPPEFFSWMVRASGIWGLVLLMMMFIMIGVIIANLVQIHRDNMIPDAFVTAFEEKLAARDYQGAYDVARADDSLIARLMAAGLGRLNRGYDEALKGMHEIGEEESMVMEHRLSWLAMIGSVATMIGLLGTVWGMIQSFRVIANSSTQPKPRELAEGIATALFTTLEGLIVAIPAIVAYGLLRNRISRLLLEVGRVSEGLISRFARPDKETLTPPTKTV